MMRRAALYGCLTLAAACGGAKAPPPATPPSSAPAPSVSTELEANRLHVQASGGPVVELRVVFEAGSVDDPSGQEGLTVLTVGTMLEGRAGGLGYAERERLLFPMAAEIGGNVEREQVVFVGRVHRDHLAAFYPLFRDVIAAPAFDGSDFARIRDRSLSTLTQELRGQDDERLGKEVLQAMMFERHPYGVPELGTERGLSAASAEDARQHWARVLCAKRVRVAVSGPADEVFLAAVRKDFGALTSAACTPSKIVPKPEPTSARRIVIVDKPEAQSVAISMGTPIAVTRSHPDYPALTLAAAYFGQHRTFAGRLMQKMRADRGLNYGDYAYAEHFVQDGHSRFPSPNVSRREQYFSMWLRPVPVDKAHFALRMAVRELELLVNEGLSQADFERIQRFTERYFALFAQTEQQRLGNLLDDAFYGVRGPHLDVLRAGLRGLTRERVNEALKRHVNPAALQIALVAPNASELSRAIAANARSPIRYASEKPKEILEEDKLIEVHPVAVRAEQIAITPLREVFR